MKAAPSLSNGLKFGGGARIARTTIGVMYQSKPSVLALCVLKRAALVAAKDHAGVVQAHVRDWFARVVLA
jgi:hypothetical protein